MSKYISNSYDCVKSELDLFFIPPTNTSIETGGWSVYTPTTSIDSGPIEFAVESSDSEYIHLNRTMLYLNVAITKSGNTYIDATDTVGPINNLAHSLFTQIDLSLRNENIESNRLYPYKAYINNLLNYGYDSKNSLLQTCVFVKDTAGHMDLAEFDAKNEAKKPFNEGLLKRKELFVRGKGSVDMIIKPYCDLFNSDRYLLNGVNFNLKLTRSSSAFCLIAGSISLANIDIKNALLLVRKVRISPSILLAHSMALEKATAKYPIKRVIVNSYTIPSNVQDFTSSNLTSSVLPLRVIVGMVENEALNGSYTKNPFNFQHFNLKRISLTLNSQDVPYFKGLDFNFANDKYIRGYNTLFEGIDGPAAINGNNITRTDYPDGYFLIAFDISPDLCSGDHFNLLKTGNLQLQLIFDRQLEKAISVIVYMEFDNVVEINQSRKVFKDYIV